MGFKVPLDPHPSPPENFNQLNLTLSYNNGFDYYRLNRVDYNSAIYFDAAHTRRSSPQGDDWDAKRPRGVLKDTATHKGRFDGQEQSYGICYLGETIEAAFIECFGRELGIKFLTQEFIKSRNLFIINSERQLKLVDLFGSGLAKLGADKRLTGGDYDLSRQWAEAIYQHPERVDGIRYYSRYDDTQLCCGLFDRSIHQLQEKNTGDLIESDVNRLANILNRYDFGIL